MAERISKDGKEYYASRILRHANQMVNMCPPCTLATAVGAKSVEAPFGWFVYMKSKKELRFYTNEDWKAKISTTSNPWEVGERMWQSKIPTQAGPDDYVTYAMSEEMLNRVGWNFGDQVIWEHVVPKTGVDYLLLQWNCRDEDMPKMLYTSQEKEIYRVIKNTLLIQGDEDLAKTLEKNKAFVEMKNQVDEEGNPQSTKITMWDGQGSILHEFDSDASEQQLINVQPVEL